MSQANAFEYIRSADIAVPRHEAAFAPEPVPSNPIDFGALPDGVVTGTTLLDISNVTDPRVRSGVSLAMLFASRVAEKDANADDPDSWLASYQNALTQIGFSVSGAAVTTSVFHKTNVSVHKALLPFLSIALGGAAAGPIIHALLEQLGNMDPDTPWITIFDRQVRRFDVQEMHFAAAREVGSDTEIRYAVARLNVEIGTTRVLFFKINRNSAQFESMTNSMRINNSLMITVEPELMSRLSALSKKYIWDATI